MAVDVPVFSMIVVGTLSLWDDTELLCSCKSLIFDSTCGAWRTIGKSCKGIISGLTWWFM